MLNLNPLLCNYIMKEAKKNFVGYEVLVATINKSDQCW